MLSTCLDIEDYAQNFVKMIKGFTENSIFCVENQVQLTIRLHSKGHKRSIVHPLTGWQLRLTIVVQTVITM